MAIFTYKNINPKIHGSVFIAEGVQIIGDVEIGAFSNVWYNAVIRGDVNAIRIGEGTNIQDGCILHTSYDTQALLIGNNITVGHNVILHSCTIEDYCLIGMGSTVLDGALIRKNAIVGAGALVPPGMEVKSGTLVVGVPAKVVRMLSQQEIENFTYSAQHYQDLAAEHSKNTRIKSSKI